MRESPGFKEIEAPQKISHLAIIGRVLKYFGVWFQLNAGNN